MCPAKANPSPSPPAPPPRKKRLTQKEVQELEDRCGAALRFGDRKTLDKLPQLGFLTYGECVGIGHFSHVYEGMYQGRLPAAIKVIERGLDLVDQEIALLMALKGIPHIIQLYQVVNVQTKLLIFELVRGMTEDEFFDSISLPRFRFVLRCIFEALQGCHSRNIIHRDLTIGNILVSSDWSEVRIIDWGCATEVRPGMDPKSGSRTSRSIEMLMSYPNYGTASDIWAVGVFIFYVLTGGDIPLKSNASWETIVKLGGFFGTAGITEAADRLKIQIPKATARQLAEVQPKNVADFVAPESQGLVDPKLFDLMNQLFNMNMEARLTAEQALQHPFFADDQ
jgi:serine/threonine protein kinase